MSKRIMIPARLWCAAVVGLWAAAGVTDDTVESGALQLNLQRALELALAQNRNLAITAMETNSAGLAVSNAQAEFQTNARPAISLNSNAEGSSSSSLGISASRKLTTGTELSARLAHEELAGSDSGQERLVVEISQPLFRFTGRLVNEEPIVQARSNLVRARRQLSEQKQDLVVSVVREYENILRLEQQLKADHQSHERSRALFRSTRAKEALGRASRIDTLRVDLQRGQALSRLETNREGLESAHRAFAELLGFDPGIRFQLRPTVPLDIEVPRPEEALRVALNNRLDYAQALQDRRDARRGVRIARKGLWPDLRLVARYEHINDLSGGVLSDDDRVLFGLSAGTDFNRVRERNAIRQSRIEERSATQLVQLFELSIARELQQRILAYRRASADIEIRKRNLEHARARLALARRLYEFGRSDNFTVTDAEQALVQAESQWLAGKSEASITAYELLRAMGTLTDVPEALRPWQP